MNLVSTTCHDLLGLSLKLWFARHSIYPERAGDELAQQHVADEGEGTEFLHGAVSL